MRSTRRVPAKNSFLTILLLLFLLGSSAGVASYLLSQPNRPASTGGDGGGTTVPPDPIGGKPVYDLIIKGGTVVDGSGGPVRRADVGVIGDRITALGDLSKASAKKTIDATGLAVAPGFINIHSHTPDYLPDNKAYRDAWAAIRQGITLEVGGADGRSPTDLTAHFQRIIDGGGLNYNLATMVGQGSVRQAVMGTVTRAATGAEIDRMRSLVRQAMKDGAFGLSTGLEYVPGRYTSQSEVTALAAEVAPFGGIYATHMRNEAAQLPQAVDEAIAIAKQAGVALDISHIKAAGRPNWPLFPGVLDRIDAARAGGQNIIADMYPWRSLDKTVDLRLADVRNSYQPQDLLVRKSSGYSEYLGSTLADIATKMGVTPVVAADRLLAKDPETAVAALVMSDDNIKLGLGRAFTAISNDDEAYPIFDDPQKILAVHPRAHGTFPLILGSYVRDQKVLTLETAVYKMTGLPAKFLGLKDRGLIKEGYFADLVVFDPKTVNSRATYVTPQLPPAGILYVAVNGVLEVSDGQPVTVKDAAGNMIGPRAGRILRKGQ